jgi:prepilin signal peptidase PulO-like enzyme (type II secretory pathway)
MIITGIFLALLGLAFGSFADAIAWRLHTKRNFTTDRSECEHCHHKLGPLDLIPVLSWLFLQGKCRYCKKPISPLAPFTEATMAILFALSYMYWPLGFSSWQGDVLFGLWLVYLVVLGILFVYDVRWQLLPDKLVYPLVALSFVDAAIQISLHGGGVAAYAAQVVLGAVAMAGVYGVLYVVSQGRWVGFGDVKLAIFIGAVLGWEKTLLVLMLANIIGLLVVAPGLITGKLTPKSHVPFGPFMIIAFVIAGLFGDTIIHWYLHAFVLV